MTDGQTFRLQSADAGATCFGTTGVTIPCLLIEQRRQEGRALREASDVIVRGDLVGLLTDGLADDPWARPAGPIDVIAHRGLSLVYPENTLKAIDAAFTAGADAAEVDIRLSRDGVPVVFHDDTLERTSNGRGAVEALSVAELKRLDAGSWMDTRFAGERIPTLEEVVRLAKGRGRLLLDLKVEGMASAIAKVYSRAAVDPSDAMIGAWTDTERADFALICRALAFSARGRPQWSGERITTRSRGRPACGASNWATTGRAPSSPTRACTACRSSPTP